MKRKFSVIFILCTFLISVSFLFGSAKKSKVLALDNNVLVEDNFQTKSIYLVDYNSNTVIFKKNEKDKRPIASMCKIMTLILGFDFIKENNLSFEDKIIVSKTASGMGGSQVFLEENGEYKLDDIFKSIVVASANDACVALAEKVCGSEDDFVAKMNEKASELGMDDTNFVNCTGLPKTGQYSTAKDVSIMFRELIKHKEYFNYSTIWTDEISHPKDRKTAISNTNKLVRFFEGCDSGKTGYTSEAGHCLASSAVRNGMRIISVFISSPDSKTRFKEVSQLYNYTFKNYTNKLIVGNENPLEFSVVVKGGKKDSLRVIPEKPIYLFGKIGDKKVVDIDVKIFEGLKAPISKGDIVGEIQVFENGNKIASSKILSYEDILSVNYFDSILKVIKNMQLVKF